MSRPSVTSSAVLIALAGITLFILYSVFFKGKDSENDDHQRTQTRNTDTDTKAANEKQITMKSILRSLQKMKSKLFSKTKNSKLFKFDTSDSDSEVDDSDYEVDPDDSEVDPGESEKSKKMRPVSPSPPPKQKKNKAKITFADMKNAREKIGKPKNRNSRMKKFREQRAKDQILRKSKYLKKK